MLYPAKKNGLPKTYPVDQTVVSYSTIGPASPAHPGGFAAGSLQVSGRSISWQQCSAGCFAASSHLFQLAPATQKYLPAEFFSTSRSPGSHFRRIHVSDYFPSS